MRERSNIERVYAILDTIVKYDLNDVKDEWTRHKIINARDLAFQLFDEELRAPHAALVETFPHAEAAQ